jgi:hypothetical protein
LSNSFLKKSPQINHLPRSFILLTKIASN